MEARWWSCVLGVLCVTAEVKDNAWTVSQSPSSIALMRVNLSAEITCSTSLNQPTGLYLKRRFHGDSNVIYLSLQNRRITKNTTLGEYVGRIRVTPDLQTGRGYAVTLRLSRLRLDDTDMYYCSWKHLDLKMAKVETLPTDGTVIIIRERDPQERCAGHVSDVVLVVLSVIAFTVVSFLFIAALVFKCTRFKKQFRPARPTRTLSLNPCQHDRGQRPQHRDQRPQHRDQRPQHRDQRPQHSHPSADTPDFRGFLSH